MTTRLLVLTAVTLAAALTACGQAREPAPAPAASGLQRVQNTDRPEITPQAVAKDVVGRKVMISELNQAGPEDEWTFEADEFRRVDILERRATETGADLLVFMLTMNVPGSQDLDVQVSGQLRLHYEWKNGQWRLGNIENLSFRYSIGRSI